MSKQITSVMGLGGGFPAAMVISAVVLVVATAVECGENTCDDEEVLALILGSVLLLTSMLYLIFYWNISDTMNTIACVFFFAFWGFSAGYITFEGPFVTPGNGYFAAWAGFASATGLLAYNVREFDRFKSSMMVYGLPLLLLAAGSIVVIIAGVANGCCDENDTIAIVAGSVSLVFTLLRVLMPELIPHYFFAMFMLAWWLVLGLILTFDVFEIVGNGYFGVLSCVLSSVYLSMPSTQDAPNE